MYDQHFGLTETPFTIAPDPRFLYMSERHRDALAHLMYCFSTDGGFVLLTGEVGTGKTTISRCLLEQLPANVDVAMILNPKQSALELLASICDELGIEYPEFNDSLKIFVDCINKRLLETNAQGRKTVVIIEEAQNLEMDVLEQLRLLTNLETNQRKLMQIIMIGQPELLELLARPELRQLEQRITARYHLLPLSRRETMDYVQHRLGVAGLKGQVFSSKVLSRVYEYTSGIPRKINVLCDRAMLGAYVQNQRFIDIKILERAAKEVFGEGILKKNNSFKKYGLWIGAALVFAMAGVGLSAVFFKSGLFSPDDQVVQALPLDRAANPAIADSTSVSQVAINPLAGNSAIEDSSANVLSMLNRMNTKESYYKAFRAVFSAWGDDYSPGSHKSCSHADEVGLSCLEAKGNFATLERHNRPAILKMLNGEGKQVFVALLQLTPATADIVLAGQRLTVPRQLVEKHWFGDYTILWRKPPNYSGPITPGSSGPEVDWLTAQMDEITGGRYKASGIVHYSLSMVTEVKQLQKAAGLLSDGIAGAQTIIQINSLVGKGVPKLAQGDLLTRP